MSQPPANCPLYGAALRGNTAALGTILSGGADPNVWNAMGLTPLHAAAGGGHATSAELLLRYGALVDSLDDIGSTPLMLAAHCGSEVTCQVLLEHGARLSHTSCSGVTALLRAVASGSPETVACLLASGAIPSASDGLDATPLHWAAVQDGIMCRPLLRSLAPVDARDRDGRTPLHWACSVKCTSSAAILLLHGADHEASDLAGSTPSFEWSSSLDAIVGRRRARWARQRTLLLWRSSLDAIRVSKPKVVRW